MEEPKEYLTFKINDQKYALPVSQVERVVNAVAITRIAAISKNIMGILNFGGRIIPVIDIRNQLQLRSKLIELSDYIIIAKSNISTLAFFVDQICGTSQGNKKLKVNSAKGFEAFDKQIDEIVEIEDEMVLIYSLDRFLLPHEKLQFDELAEIKNEDVKELPRSLKIQSE